MKHIIGLLAVGAVGLLNPPAVVADEAALIQKGGCVACHSVDKKILGPAFKDVAAKYKGKDVEAALTKKVKEGGSGVWGPMPMPANTGKLSDEEFKSVVNWILKQ